MKLQIALIAAIFGLTAISAFSLEGFKCKDYPVANGDTVRICGVMDHEAETNYFPHTENRVQAAHPQSLYGRDGIWSKPEFQTSTLSNNWQSSNGAPGTHAFRAYRHIGSDNPMRSYIHQQLEPRSALEAKQIFQEKQLNTLVEDVSEVKNSVKDLTTYLKSIVDKLVVREENEPLEGNINVNFKLDPSLEAIVNKFVELMVQSLANSTEKNDEQSSTVSTDNVVEGTSEYFGSREEVTTENENNSDENISGQHEESSTEDSSNEYQHTVDDLNSWVKEHFGPNINKRVSDEEIEELFNQRSEELEKSTEITEDSFETWFNKVYRKISTEASTTENNNSEENIDDSKEESNKNSKSTEDSNQENKYKENAGIDDVSKSSGENTVTIENNNHLQDETNEDTIFVPIVSQEITNMKHLKNGDRYGYKDISSGKFDDLYNCLLKNDDHDIVRTLLACKTEFAARLREAGLPESNESTETNSNESKDSTETEAPAKDSDESKDSNETETPAKDSDETKESSETEAAGTDSYEWLRSFETDALEHYDDLF